MREEYYYQAVQDLFGLLSQPPQDRAYWGAFMSVACMVGEVCIEQLPGGQTHLEVCYYHLDHGSGKPKAVDGFLVRSSLSFQWNPTVTSMYWNSSHVLDLGIMSFNRFRMYMDNLDIYDYHGEYAANTTLDGEVIDPYDYGQSPYDMRFKGSQTANWFGLKST